MSLLVISFRFLAALGIFLVLIVTLVQRVPEIITTTTHNKDGVVSVSCKATAVDTSTDNIVSGSAVSGKTFNGEKIRAFQGQRRLMLEQRASVLRSSPLSSPNSNKMDNDFPITAKLCDKWAVVTTIFAPTDAVKAVARLSSDDGWCLVIVGDTKTPNNYLKMTGIIIQENENQNTIVYLSVAEQKKIHIPFVQMLPFASFSRKNVGFLFAIRHGAKVIFDFDDDNVLKTSPSHDGDSKPMSPFTYNLRDDTETMTLRSLIYNDNNSKRKPAFNPLSLMQPSSSSITLDDTSSIVWPRGFPLQDLQDETTTGIKNAKIGTTTIPISSIGVIQSVCDLDPDFDAIYRLTRPLPVTFASSSSGKGENNMNLLIPLDLYTPYNAQATIHMYKAFWGMILPFTVHGRVSDIWRSYFTQRIMHDLQLALVYAPPIVTHHRSAHDYLADFAAEQDLYLKSGALLTFLKDEWNDSTSWLPQRIENLCIALYERDYIQLEDVYAMQEWLLALLDIGYQFPELNNVKPLVPTTTTTTQQ